MDKKIATQLIGEIYDRLAALEGLLESETEISEFDGIIKVNTADGPRFVGIRKEARRLGVTQAHLWSVLTGKRESKSLMRRVQIKEVK